MFPATINPIRLYQGDTVVFPVLVFTTNGVPFDFSGWLLSAKWQSNAGGQSVTLNHVVDGNRVAISGTSEMSAAITCDGRWDLRGEQAGVVRTFCTGTTVLVEDVAS